LTFVRQLTGAQTPSPLVKPACGPEVIEKSTSWPRTAVPSSVVIVALTV
jgi:hypothetical protein